MLDNLRYAERLAHHSYLYGIELDDQSRDEHSLVHMILGANEYIQIRTRTVMSPAIKTDVGPAFWRSMGLATTKDYVLWTCSVEQIL